MPSAGSLLDRVRRALAPGLEVEAELGSGGMGVVFAGRDPVLDRPVAIKVLRPEAATAVAAERFLREGRLLARLDHPNIVKVHQAGRADGLFYLVMDRLEGERLDHRLGRGALAPDEVIRLGRALLDALAAIHAAGVVHRDIKPSNILTAGGRPMLVDFGIASDGSERGDLTAPGSPIGTPAYMAPEQAMGRPASTATDIWALGATLYEAAAGGRFDPAGANEWSAVPAALAPALRRALALDPAQRWSSAEAFRAALTGRRRAGRRLVLGALAGVVAAGVAIVWLWPAAPAPAGRKPLALAPLVAAGPVATALRDSVERALAARLRGYPDFELVADRPDRRDALRLEGRLRDLPEGLRLELSLRNGGRTLSALATSVRERAGWTSLVDSASDGVALAILAGPLRSDPWIPSAALPGSPGALRLLLDGERYFASGRWEEALAAYLEAERADSTCLLCSFRLVDVGRWLNWEPDPDRTVRLLRSTGRFPPHYRMLIEADALDLAERLDSLDAATGRYRDFPLVWYRYGEELFHRGPLVGRLAGEAAEPLRRTVALRPDFAPAWNHLAWLAIAEGDSAAAARALREYQRLEGLSPGLPFLQLAVLVAAQAWRFGGGAAGPAVTTALLEDPRLTSQRLLAASPRLLLAYRTWDGAIWLGRRLAALGDAELVRNGLLGEALGSLGAGRLDSMNAAARRLRDATADEETRLFAAGLPAMAALAERDSLDAGAAARLAGPLLPYLEPDAHRRPLRRAAAFLAGAVALAAGGADLTQEAERVLRADPMGEPYLRLLSLLRAQRSNAAAAARPDSVLAAAPWVLEEQPAARVLLMLSRARWQARNGGGGAALRTLRLVEHQNLAPGVPLGAPLPADIEWALGPIARWTEAGMLDAADADRPRRCRLYADLAAGWRQAAAPFDARAREAASRLAALGCGSPR